MMSAEEVPVEILVMIFKKLNGKGAVACRAVCRRWRDVLDSLSDEVWECYCSRDFRNPKTVHKVANPGNLSYRELYKSLTLWSRVEQAEVTCKTASEKFVHRFKILNNNTLAIVVNLDEGFSFYMNQIQYYNLTNMELISSERYDFEFLVYDETEKLIVLLGVDERLWVITKSNKKKLCLGHLNDNKMRNFKLFDTVVYYVNRQSILCAAQLRVIDSEDTVEITELKPMRHPIVAFASSGKDSNIISLLTDNAILMCYNGANGNMIAFIHLPIESEGSTLITYLMELGFDWTDPFFYQWLRTIDNKNVGLPAMKTSVVHTHNHIVLVGTPRRTVHIFKQPYKKNKTIKLYKSKPNRTIEMGGSSYNWPSCIQQLGVVEVLNGHRIIVLNTSQLFFVDVLHYTTTKQSVQCTDHRTKAKKKSRIANNKSVKDNKTPSKTKGNEKATKKPGRVNKNKKTTRVVTKHGYNTRSMDKCSRSTKKKQ